jgi:hypothetical protein
MLARESALLSVQRDRRLDKQAMDFFRIGLHPDPLKRATLQDLRDHPFLQSAFWKEADRQFAREIAAAAAV